MMDDGSFTASEFFMRRVERMLARFEDIDRWLDEYDERLGVVENTLVDAKSRLARLTAAVVPE